MLWCCVSWIKIVSLSCNLDHIAYWFLARVLLSASLTLFYGNSGIYKNKRTSFWNFFINSGFRKFRHSISIVEASYQLSSTKVDAQSVINWTVVGQLSWQYLRAPTLDRCSLSHRSSGSVYSTILSRGSVSDNWYLFAVDCDKMAAERRPSLSNSRCSNFSRQLSTFWILVFIFLLASIPSARSQSKRFLLRQNISFYCFSSENNFSFISTSSSPSVFLTLLVERQVEHPVRKNWVIRCWCGYLSGAGCRLFAYGPADATASQNPVISCLI